MTENINEIRFYHLQRQPITAALPKLLEKALSTGKNIVLRMNNAQAVKKMDQHLWIYESDSFLPHGCVDNDQAAHQPVWISDKDTNPAAAEVLICAGHGNIESEFEYGLKCIVFEDHDQETVQAARDHWKALKDQDVKLTYWQQSDNGKWENKATS